MLFWSLSPAVLPTNELAAETGPTTPPEPLNQVTAPAFVCAPLSQYGVSATALLPPTTCSMPTLAPTSSPIVPPTSEFAADTVPNEAAAPLPQVIAPTGMPADICQALLSTK